MKFSIKYYFIKCDRLAFSRFLDLRGNLGIVKEKPTRKTCFSREKKRLAPRINGISIIFPRETDYKTGVSIWKGLITKAL